MLALDLSADPSCSNFGEVSLVVTNRKFFFYYYLFFYF